MKSVVLAAAFAAVVVSGSAFAEEPAYWIPCLHSTGSQGIVLPITGRANLTFEMRVRWDTRDNSSWTALGCEDKSDSVAYAPFCIGNTRRWCYYYASTTVRTGGTSEPNSDTQRSTQTLRVVFRDGVQEFYVNGTLTSSGTLAAGRDLDVPLGLFGRYCKNANGGFGFSNCIKATVWWLKIYDADEKLIFDGKPCLDADGHPGLYDSVTDQTYVSSTGTDLKGEGPWQDGKPNVCYVAPVAVGRGDGSSWANATASLAWAMSDGGLNPSGGEVRIKKGCYNVTGGTQSLSSNVKVSGGYAGEDDDEAPTGTPDETIITSADCTQTWVAKGADGDVDTGVLVVDTSAGKLNLPPASDYPSGTAWCPSASHAAKPVSMTYAFSQSSAAMANASVANLTLALFSGTALSMTSQEGDGFTVTNCFFVGCVRDAANVPTVLLANSDITLVDCRFYGNGAPVRLTGTTRDGLMTVKNCIFKYNHNSKDYNGNVLGSGLTTENARMVVSGCRFEEAVSNPTALAKNHGSYYAGALHIGGVSANRPQRDVTVQNCVFANNHCSNLSEGLVILNGYVTCNLLISGCLFEKNDNRPCLKVCGPNSNGSLRVWDTLFADNSCEATGAAYSIGQFSFLHNSIEFVNCEFARNSARGGAGSATMYNEPSRPANLSVVHCLFHGNDVFQVNGESETRLPEIDWSVTSYQGQDSSAFVNTIMTHTAADYVAIHPYARGVYAHTYLKGTDMSGTASSNQGWKEDLLTDIAGAPGLMDLPIYTSELGASFTRLEETSPLRRKGMNVYLGSDGYCYVYRAGVGKWISLQTSGGTSFRQLTADEIAARGLSLANKSVADVRGADRPRKVSPGPVDFGVPGLMLLVR